jgi:HrpA-like RNA helicase
MGLPTLLKHNVIIPHMGETKQQISNITGIDFILQWFQPRIYNPSSVKNISDKIIILKSATGSGKSTVFPTEFYLRFYKIMKKNIIVTQPRILTAVSIPKIIASENAYKKENREDGEGIELFKNIGYQTKEYIRKPLEKGILFCTIGVLLQFLKNMPIENFFKKYGCIIIDEAHERSTNLD